MSYLRWYREGTITVGAAATTVTGILTGWLSDVRPGDAISANGTYWAEIASVESNTSLTLAAPWAGGAVTGSTYTIDRRSLARQMGSDVGARVEDYLQRLRRVPLPTLADAGKLIEVAPDGLTLRLRSAYGVYPQPGGVSNAGLFLAVSQAGDSVTLVSPPRVATNLLINGDFQINQRAFAGGALADGQYGYDRWKAVGAVSLTRNGYFVTLSTTAAGYIGQVVELRVFGVDSLAGQIVTVSVDSPSADLIAFVGAVSGTITAGAGRRSVSITVAASDTGATLPVYLIRAAGPGTVSFGRVQFEIGSTPGEWRPRPQPQELALAQRYFCATYNGVSPGASTPEGAILCAAPIAGYAIAPTFNVRMRATPTLTLWSATGLAGHGTSFSGNGNRPMTVNGATASGIYYFSGSTLLAGDFSHVHYHANAEL